ncbi:hypothetical protein ES707_07102 [subsurface metagenome]
MATTVGGALSPLAWSILNRKPVMRLTCNTPANPKIGETNVNNPPIATAGPLNPISSKTGPTNHLYNRVSPNAPNSFCRGLMRAAGRSSKGLGGPR